MSYSHIVPKEDKLKCIVCDCEFKSALQRNRHLKQIHNLTYENYIMLYYFNNTYPKCKCGCNTNMIFINTPFGKWFNDYCTNHFPRNKHTQETKDKIKKNTIKSIQNKFGVDNIMEIPKYIDKIKTTKQEKYNDSHYNNIDKNKETKLTKYGDEKYNNHEQNKITNLEKYGVEYYSQTTEYKNKSKKTCLDKYGVDSYNKTQEQKDKSKKTKFERYGYEYYSGTKKYKKSKPELLVCEKLNGESGFMYLGREFDIRVGNNIYEIDGDFWHPSKLENLCITFTKSNNRRIITRKQLSTRLFN